MIVLVPAATPVATPVLLTMVALLVALLLQVALLVTSVAEPSEYCSIAEKCIVLPAATVGLSGVITSPVKVGAPTVREVLPLIPPDVAVIILDPWALLVAKPPAAIVAADVLELDQVTSEVILAVDPSE